MSANTDKLLDFPDLAQYYIGLREIQELLTNVYVLITTDDHLYINEGLGDIFILRLVFDRVMSVCFPSGTSYQSNLANMKALLDSLLQVHYQKGERSTTTFIDELRNQLAQHRAQLTNDQAIKDEIFTWKPTIPHLQHWWDLEKQQRRYDSALYFVPLFVYAVGMDLLSMKQKIHPHSSGPGLASGSTATGSQATGPIGPLAYPTYTNS